MMWNKPAETQTDNNEHCKGNFPIQTWIVENMFKCLECHIFNSLQWFDHICDNLLKITLLKKS